MNAIRFVDTTLRDGHQSLWAENMTTGMMLPIAERMDQAGFEGIELISGSHLKKCVKELKEDPWERVRLVAEKITRTPLRVIAGRVNTFEYNPPSMYRLFMERMAANGIREARISEEWNEFAGWKRKAQVAHDVGMRAILNLIYSVSPKHTDDYFAQKTRAAASLNIYRLCLKDPGGLLTPERMQTLVPVIFKNANGIPVELHTHCTTGLGPLCCIEGMKLGIRSINTALPPLADATSNPSLFNVAKNARAGICNGDRRRSAAAGVATFRGHCQTGRPSHRGSGGIRLLPVPPSSSGRHALQSAPSTAQGRLGA